ncbi:helix-turn-helix transcriptional regulator [Chakrabartyella piscis]|uniref:helix-turn-helix domain-containing protein n=1 Tax=Chakrabartyella piscis TaxID=2918914 RepID=UPI0029587B15|nr:helix-turn-helix transcriptional regulator [Chakrabartyella piscis]
MMISDKIVFLREQHNMTQASLAKTLGITRSSVNAWEMGISVPSTQYIVELSTLFGISTDYLLDISKTVTMDVSGLNNEDIEILYILKEHLKKNKTTD